VSGSAPGVNIEALLALPGVLSVVPVSVPSAILGNPLPTPVASAAAVSDGVQGTVITIAVTAVATCTVLAAAASLMLWIHRSSPAHKAGVPFSQAGDASKALGDGCTSGLSSTAAV
jgi:hypothetical protein